MTDTAALRTAIVDAARGVLDWEGQPFNIAPDEAQRDYEHLAEAIITAIREAGFMPPVRWPNWDYLDQRAKAARLDGGQDG